MKFSIPTCPFCGVVPDRAEHSTLGSQDLVRFDDGSFDWSDGREDSSECDVPTCIADAQNAVFNAASALVDAAVRTEKISLETIGDLLGKLGAAVKEARTHEDGSCIVLHCPDCMDTWHARIEQEVGAS